MKILIFKKNNRWQGIWLWLLLLLVGCASHQMLRPSAKAQQNRTEHYLRLLQNRYVEKFTSTQRIVLQIGKRQFDFIGYLSMHNGRAFRAVAVGDMGGKFFDILFNEGNVQILVKPDKMPKNPLLYGVVGDIRHLFSFSPGSDNYLSSDDQGRIAFINAIDKNNYQIYTFSADTPDALIYSCDIVDGKIIREVTFLDNDQNMDATQSLHRKMILRNHRYHYQMEIEILKVEPQILSDEIFNSTK